MRLSELQHKDIVNLEGKKIGNIIDVKVSRDGQIEALVVDGNRNLFKIRKNNEENEVLWEKITKIGTDVILVDM